MASRSEIEVSVRVSEAEFLAWNRAAFKARYELEDWLRIVVNEKLRQRAPRSSPRPEPARRRPLEPLEDEPPYQCEYCGWMFDFTATRRKRYCSDDCRVKAWRLRKRLSSRSQGEGRLAAT
jgi:hypothetical protein